MAKFKIGDRVRVVGIDENHGSWFNRVVGEIGTVTEDDVMPIVNFDNGERDYGEEKYLELVESEKPKINPLTISTSAELTHITIGGKRFRLVQED